MAPFLCREHLCQSPWADDVPDIILAFPTSVWVKAVNLLCVWTSCNKEL